MVEFLANLVVCLVFGALGGIVGAWLGEKTSEYIYNKEQDSDETLDALERALCAMGKFQEKMWNTINDENYKGDFTDEMRSSLDYIEEKRLEIVSKVDVKKLPERYRVLIDNLESNYNKMKPYFEK